MTTHLSVHSSDHLYSKDIPYSTLGIIAGNGEYPVMVSASLKKMGLKVYICAHHNESVDDIHLHADKVKWVRPGQIKKIKSFFKKHGCEGIIFAGGLKKGSIFNLRPDLHALALLAKLNTHADDKVLRALSDYFKGYGLPVINPTSLLPTLYANKGVIVGHGFTPNFLKEIDYANKYYNVASALDIGQTLILRHACIISIEGIEGTDECIKRSATYTDAEQSLIVKFAKKNQDLRFDAPSIGPETIKLMHAYKYKYLVIHANKTLIIKPEETIALALKYNINIEAIDFHA